MSEELARRFHEVYERLAPSHGYKTREETRDFDPKSPNGKLMIRVCGEVCGEQQAENKRLRKLLKDIVDGSHWDGNYMMVPHHLMYEAEKEVRNELGH